MKYEEINCEICGTKVTPGTSWGKYCSAACKQKAYNLRKKGIYTNGAVNNNAAGAIPMACKYCNSKISMNIEHVVIKSTAFAGGDRRVIGYVCQNCYYDHIDDMSLSAENKIQVLEVCLLLKSTTSEQKKDIKIKLNKLTTNLID